jgi:uncharacterized protein (DUF488 family)
MATPTGSSPPKASAERRRVDLPAVAHVRTVGHGARPIGELIEVLASFGIHRLVDVRRYPGSRLHPHFGRDALAASLEKAGIEYVFEGEALGGRRSPSPGSRHTAVRSAQFRGYADHMETEEFRSGRDRLLAMARETPTAVMCAETLPWKCHRSFLSDALVARGAAVTHLLRPGEAREHSLSAAARVEGESVVYDRAGKGSASGGARLPFSDELGEPSP